MYITRCAEYLDLKGIVRQTDTFDLNVISRCDRTFDNRRFVPKYNGD